MVMEEFKEFLKQSHDNLSNIDFVVDREFAVADKNLDSHLTLRETFDSFLSYFKKLNGEIPTDRLFFRIFDSANCEKCKQEFWQDGPHLMNCCLSLICRTCHIDYLESLFCPACKSHSDSSYYTTRSEGVEDQGPRTDVPLSFTGKIICDAHQGQEVTFYDFDANKFYCNECDESSNPKPEMIEVSLSTIQESNNTLL